MDLVVIIIVVIVVIVVVVLLDPVVHGSTRPLTCSLPQTQELPVADSDSVEWYVWYYYQSTIEQLRSGGVPRVERSAHPRQLLAWTALRPSPRLD